MEIISIILEEIDDKKSLFKSRLISKDFMDVATPLAFRKLTVSRSDTSLKGIENLAKSPLADFVLEVTFKEHGNVSLHHTNEPFRLALTLHIPAFFNLTSLQFSFPDCYRSIDPIQNPLDLSAWESHEIPVDYEEEMLEMFKDEIANDLGKRQQELHAYSVLPQFSPP